MTTIEEGATAPDFTLPGDNGSTVALSGYRGKPVVVYFYPKDNTSGCTKQAIAFSELAGAFDAAGVALVGISPDPVSSHDTFKARNGLGFALASDTSTDVAQAYGVWAEKTMYGRKYMGIERSTFLLDKDGTVAKVWRKVKVPGHADAVLQAAQAL
ncbi:thioredoxin-dependent thiol peroxidase [Acuticoccus sp.]|uniref:thioredoxin-dependent thiol peroxidase n=1 Tax=Acuticoccus sp. TaxID=1904378 RepID=UPI003B51D60E